MGNATQQFCFTKVNVVCKTKVIFLLLLFGVFVVLMEGLLRKKPIVLKCIAQGFSGTCDLVSWWLF